MDLLTLIVEHHEELRLLSHQGWRQEFSTWGITLFMRGLKYSEQVA